MMSKARSTVSHCAKSESFFYWEKIERKVAKMERVQSYKNNAKIELSKAKRLGKYTSCVNSATFEKVWLCENFESIFQMVGNLSDQTKSKLLSLPGQKSYFSIHKFCWFWPDFQLKSQIQRLQNEFAAQTEKMRWISVENWKISTWQTRVLSSCWILSSHW